MFSSFKMAGKGADLWRDQTARGWRIETANRALLIICTASMVSSWSFHCMKTLFLFLILATLTFGQSVVKPLRVSITTDERDSQYRAFAGRMRAELTRAGRVAIVSEKAAHHYNLVLSASPITTDASCKGFVAAMVVSSAAGLNNLSVHVGDRYDTMARAMIEKLEEEYFNIDVNDDGFVGPKVEGQ